jgi:3',5'-cyclic AMP phosphodiesterase CpdA
LRAALVGIVLAAVPRVAAEFRVAPYLQHVTQHEISIVWWSPDATPGTLEWGPTPQYGNELVSKPEPVDAVSTVVGGQERPTCRPYRHEIRLSGLQPDARYHYSVRQGQATWAAHFTTAAGARTDFTFVVAADPESKATEPRRSQIHRALLDQIRARDPRFIVYAGDLVDHGNAQDDWDAFWTDLSRATPGASIAATIPVYPALGNHDYCGLNTTLGGNRVAYAQPFAEAGVARYRAYFTLPVNDRPPSDPRCERYYAFRYGAVTIVVLDTNNDSLSTDDPATNWDTGRWTKHPLVGENEPPEPGGQSHAPDIHGGVSGHADSRQYRWLVDTLRHASAESAFVFVVTHQAPYSSFVHGDPHDPLSGYPLRKLDTLFRQVGVAAVFSGHDESYERSVTSGSTPGSPQVHYYVVPTIADPTGLRKPVANPSWQAEYRRFIYPTDNRHHGYLSIRIEHRGSNRCRATITPHYYDEGLPANQNLAYDDVVCLERRVPD